MFTPAFPTTPITRPDGIFVKIFRNPQVNFTCSRDRAILRERNPDAHYAIGSCGIYCGNRAADKVQKVLIGFRFPGTYNLDGKIRRSYCCGEKHSTVNCLELERERDEEAFPRDSSLHVHFISHDEGVITKPGKFLGYDQVMRIPYYHYELPGH